MLAFGLVSAQAAAQVGLTLPETEMPAAPLLDLSRNAVTVLGLSLDRAPVRYPLSFRYSVEIDSTNRTVLVRQLLSDRDVLPPRRYDLDAYLDARARAELMRDWKAYCTERVLQPREGGRGGRGITISTPKIKSEAFRRVFGGETLSLNVTGNITINGEMRNEKRSQMKTAVDRAPNTNFQMKQTQNFKVTGKIGENVSVDVDQDSERMFEFENAIHLKYSSEEDGIVQSLEAGNVALSLPGTRFVTFSAQNAGLFGIKSQMKVGGLDITAIASMEKGEKKKLSLSGGKEDNIQQIYDYDYKRNTYFFLDDYFRRNFKIIHDNGLHNRPPDDSLITRIEVYKSDANFQNQMGSFRAWALEDPNRPDTSRADQMHYRGYFLRLEPLKDYYVEKTLGFIVMNMSLQESEVLAVAYRDSMDNEYGTVQLDTTSNKVFLKLVKPKSPRPSDPTWELEWKNVYSIGSRGMAKEGLEIRLYRKTPSGDPEQALKSDAGVKGFLEVFGLDRTDKNGNQNKPDNLIDENDNFLNTARGELIFPDLKPFDPEGESPLPDVLRTPSIYDTTDQPFIRQQSKFYLEVKSSSRSANYTLGMNVIENSEEVMLNGRKLVRDKDYIIEYASGSLTLTNEEARSPNARLEINYESQQMISVEKKSLLGLRAEYKFREDAAQPSYVGATLLYMNQKTMDQRIRLGQQGPMRNLVWDVNTAFNFQPNILTKALDALPVIQATAPSNLTFEGEIAQVIPNPNTLNNERTGDKNGVAYLDDFEGSKRDVPMGIIYSGWGPGSPPDPSLDARAQLARRGHMVWYNPYEQVLIQDIWPNREVTTNYGGSTLTHVLDLKFKPRPPQPGDSFRKTESWGGIQRYLSAGYSDQTNSRFLEVWLWGTQGRLHVDLGRISEDVIPNTYLDTEDEFRAGFRNKLLEEDEDKGLDGTWGADPADPFLPDSSATIDASGRAEPYDFWDVDRDRKKDAWEPWSLDNWVYQSGVRNYEHINGTENSKNASALIYPNTEDLDDNGDVDTNNDFFEYSFNLSLNHPDTALLSGGNRQGWKLYRIPLNKPSKVVGQPQWSRIEYVRLWMDSVDSDVAYVRLADVSLVGNEWKYQGVAATDSGLFVVSDEPALAIEVVNTHDNPTYEPPPGVEGEIDPIQKIRSKEQSLQISLKDLPQGATAIVQKQFYQPENLIYYKTLKMYVHGGGIHYTQFTDSLDFFLRWGSDTENKHYYEIRLPVHAGWDARNHLELEFEKLSELKVQAQLKNAYSDSIVLDNGHKVIIVGKPSLTNIRWLMVGVKNRGDLPSAAEIWIDELRLSNVRKDRGMAMRARADFRLSDFFSVNGEYNRRDADFHTVNERFGEGGNSRSGNLNASLQLHKLLPASWGFSIPVSTTFARNLSTPKYIPGTDILLNAKNPLLPQYQNNSEQRGLSVSLSKASKSRNLFLRLLADPLSGSLNLSQSHSSNSSTKFADNRATSGSFRYRLTPSDQNYVLPFSWLGKKGVWKKLAQAKFNYLPTSLNFDVTGNRSNAHSETREGLINRDTTATLSRNFDTAFQPFQMLTVDFARASSSDMRFEPDWAGSVFDDAAGIPTEKNQNFGVGLNPKVLQWFTPTAKYSANYRWSNNFQQASTGTGMNSSISSTVTLNGSFDPNKFVQAFAKKKTGAAAKAPKRPVTAAPAAKPADGEAPKAAAADGKGFALTSVFSGLGGVFKKIDPISINVTNTRSSNDNGILDTPDMDYQFGFSMDPKVRYSPNLTTNRSNLRDDERLSLRSGLKITSNLTASFDYNFSDNSNRSTQSTRSVTKSAFVVKDKGMAFPNWNVQWRGLEKVKFLSKFTKSMSLSHTFSGQQVDTYNDNRLSSTQVSKNFRPFLGLSMTLKNGITGNVQYTSTVSLTVKKDNAYSSGKTKQINNSLSVTGSYAKRGGLRLPFLKGKKLDNNIDLKLTFEKSLNATFVAKRINEDFSKDNKQSETKNWSFEPRVDYTFSSSVQGGCYLKLGQREDLRMGKTRMTAFGINCSISLAGR